MIQIFYAYTDLIKKSNLDIISEQLSLKTQSKLVGLKRYEDKCLLLTSVVLLSKVLFKNGYADYKLCDMQYSLNGRPFFSDSPFDFNISHTDNCAAIVFSENSRVGIDIERIKEVDFSDFEEMFSKNEWDKIYSSEDKIRTFYYYWTLLESAVKADGRGLSLISSEKIRIINDHLIIDEKEWFSDHQNFDPTISCCVTSNKNHKAIELHEIKVI